MTVALLCCVIAFFAVSPLAYAEDTKCADDLAEMQAQCSASSDVYMSSGVYDSAACMSKVGANGTTTIFYNHLVVKDRFGGDVTDTQYGVVSCVAPAPSPCTKGKFEGGGWSSDGTGLSCRGGCIAVAGNDPSGALVFGTIQTGERCPATGGPPPASTSPPTAGYTPDDPADPGKGGSYCASDPTVCVHGPAPSAGGSGNAGGDGTAGGSAGGDAGGSTGGGATGGGSSGGDAGGSSGGGSTGGGASGGGSTGGGSTGGSTGGSAGGSTGGSTGGASGGGSGGTGDGDGKCTAGDACTAGEAVAVPSGFYTSNGRTVGDAFTEYKVQVMGSPLLSTATGFFTVSSGGSCPVWSVPATKYTPTIRFDWLCNGSFSVWFERAGYIMLAVAAFCAFRIAFY